MRSVIALVSLVFATTCLAAPALEERQETCVPDLSSRFTFSASRFDHNETIPLGLGPVNQSTGNAFLITAPPGRVFFRLEDERIPAFDPRFRGVSIGARAGTQVSFIGRRPDTPKGLEPYCAQRLPNTGTPYLGVSGNLRDFALCVSSFENIGNVVFKPTPFNDGSYRYDTCVGAFIRMHEIEF